MVKINVDIVKISRLLKSIANESRLAILFKLNEMPMTVGALNGYIKISQSALSQHLNALRNARLVDSKRSGSSVEYRLTDKDLKETIKSLQSIFGKPYLQVSTMEGKNLTLNEDSPKFGEED